MFISFLKRIIRHYYFFLPWALWFSTLTAKTPSGHRLQAPTTSLSQVYFDANRIGCDFENNGLFVSYRIPGHSGMEWPRLMDTYVDFSSGIWIIGKINNGYGILRSAIAEYGSEFTPGPAYIPYDPLIHKIYKITRSDFQYPNVNPDFENWPIDDGAPWIDANGDGIYNVADGDHPEMLGDQIFWYVANDLDTVNHGNVFGTYPLNIEIQTTIWGYNGAYGGQSLQDMMFMKVLIINKGSEIIEDAYIGLWDDPDLGYADDDFVGCDTLLNLGFTYNDGPDMEFGVNPPSLGYVLLQGPIFESPGDTARAFGRLIPNFSNHGMTGFESNAPIYPFWGTYDVIDAYNQLRGLRKDGTPIINPETNTITRFMYSGNPDDNTSIGDGIWVDSDTRTSGDRTFLMGSGPFTMAPGDSQEVIVAIVIARGTDPLDSVTKLKSIVPITHTMAEQFFNIDINPVPVPGVDLENLFVTADNINDNRIINNGETVRLSLSLTNTTTYTIPNLRIGFSTNTDQVTVDLGSPIVLPPLPPGGTYVIQGDASPQLTVAADYTELQFTLLVTIYDPDNDLLSVENFLLPVEQLYFTPGDINAATQVAGYGDAFVAFKYVLPHEATADSYRVDITPQFYNSSEQLVDGLGVVLTNVTNSTILLDHYALPNEYGFGYPVTEGFKLIFRDVLEDFKSFKCVANAAGPIDPPTGAAADWYSYPVPERPGRDQQVGEGTWFIATWPDGSRASYDAFFARTVEYTGGANNPDGTGIKWLIPHDFEIRFTEEGGKAFMPDGWPGGPTVISVPFELWDIGTTDDIDDDYRLVPYLYDVDGNGEFNLMYDAADTTSDQGWADHEVSSGENDPWTDPFYWIHPTDNTPGTQGYDNMIAALESDPAGAASWDSQPGEAESPYDGWAGMHHMVLVLWNGGDVTWVTSPGEYDMEMPEVGTVFRIVTNKLLNTTDVFAFRTEKQNVKDPTNPDQYALYQNYPNPFNDRTNLSFYLAEESDFTLTIYDILGRELIHYDIKQHPPGYNSVQWNGRNWLGKRMPTGVYLVLMHARGFNKTKKILLLK